MASQIEVSMDCIHPGCAAQGQLRLHLGDQGVSSYGVTPLEDWMLYAAGYPSAPNLGLCPAHQEVTVGGDPPLDVRAVPDTHGLFFELTARGVMLGKVTFPSNTRTLQMAQGAPESPELWAAGRRAAAEYGFKVPT